MEVNSKIFPLVKGSAMFSDFRIAKYQIMLRAGEKGLHLPPYKGSTLRGGFGHVFHRICCSQRDMQCNACLLAQSCPYAQIFEPAPPPGSEVLKNYSDIPRPFVIEPPLETKTHYQPGETLTFGLVLIGQAITYLPYFILAFKELGNVGLGKGRLPFDLAGVLAVDLIQDSAVSIYDPQSNRVQPMKSEILGADLMKAEGIGDQLNITFLTMTRLKFEHTLVTGIPFHVLIRNLLRRISTLYYFYHGQKAADVDYKGLIADAEAVRTVSSTLQLVDWERYSNRQDVRMNMGGLVGEASYEGEWRQFAPLLRIGEVVHVGKGCVFGMGKYEIKK